MQTYDGKVERSLYYCAKGICQACHYNYERHDECMRRLIKDACEAGHTDEIIIENQRTTICEQKAEIERLTTEIDQKTEMMANLGVELDKAQEEIERLKDIAKSALNESIKVCDSILNAKSEAYKEFAERLKERSIDIDVSFGYGKEHHTEAVTVIEIDNLLTELTPEPLTKIPHSSLCETETYEG